MFIYFKIIGVEAMEDSEPGKQLFLPIMNVITAKQGDNLPEL